MSDEELQSAWKRQPAQPAINLDSFASRRSRELHAGTRAEILMSIGAVLFLLAIAIWRLPEATGRSSVAGYLLIASWIAFVVITYRRRLTRQVSPGTTPASGLDHYRNELIERREHLRSLWLWHGPLAMALLLFWRVFPNWNRMQRVVPLLLPLAVWVALSIWRRMRQARLLQSEINELNAYSS